MATKVVSLDQSGEVEAGENSSKQTVQKTVQKTFYNSES
jgi:hypothetical protein